MSVALYVVLPGRTRRVQRLPWTGLFAASKVRATKTTCFWRNLRLKALIQDAHIDSLNLIAWKITSNGQFTSSSAYKALPLLQPTGQTLDSSKVTSTVHWNASLLRKSGRMELGGGLVGALHWFTENQLIWIRIVGRLIIQFSRINLDYFSQKINSGKEWENYGLLATRPGTQLHNTLWNMATVDWKSETAQGYAKSRMAVWLSTWSQELQNQLALLLLPLGRAEACHSPKPLLHFPRRSCTFPLWMGSFLPWTVHSSSLLF